MIRYTYTCLQHLLQLLPQKLKNLKHIIVKESFIIFSENNSRQLLRHNLQLAFFFEFSNNIATEIKMYI
jgi:hypothetical protein